LKAPVNTSTAGPCSVNRITLPRSKFYRITAPGRVPAGGFFTRHQLP
jgi:hypothetical protein